MPVCFVQFKTNKVSFSYNKLENEYISVMNWRFYIYLDKLSDDVFNVKIKVFYLRDIESSEMEFITKIKLQYPSQNKKVISIQNIPIEIYIDDIKYRSYDDYTIYFSMVNNKMEYVCTTCGKNNVSISRQLESSDYIFSCKSIPCIKQFMLAGGPGDGGMEEEIELTDAEIKYQLETLQRKHESEKALKLLDLKVKEDEAKFEIELDYEGELSVEKLKEKRIKIFKAESVLKSKTKEIEVLQKLEYDQLEADLNRKKNNQTMLGKRKRITEPSEEQSTKKPKLETPKSKPSEEKKTKKPRKETPKSSEEKKTKKPESKQDKNKDVDQPEMSEEMETEITKEPKKGSGSDKMDIEKKKSTKNSDEKDSDESDIEDYQEDITEKMSNSDAINNRASSVIATSLGTTDYQLCIIPENCDASADLALSNNKSDFIKQFNWGMEEYLDYEKSNKEKIWFNMRKRNSFMIFWPKPSNIIIGDNDEIEKDKATFDKKDYNMISNIIITLFHESLGREHQVYRTIIMQPTESNMATLKTQRIPEYEAISKSVPLTTIKGSLSIHKYAYKMCCFLCDELIADVLLKTEWLSDLDLSKENGKNVYAIIMGYVKEISNYYILELIDNFLFNTEQTKLKIDSKSTTWLFNETKKRFVEITKDGTTTEYELYNKQNKGEDTSDRSDFEKEIVYKKRRHKLFFKQQTKMNNLFNQKQIQKVKIDKSVFKIFKYILANYAQYSSRTYKYMISTSKSYNTLVKVPIKKFIKDYDDATKEEFKNIFSLRTSNTFWIGDKKLYDEDIAFSYTGESPPEPKKIRKTRTRKGKNKDDDSED
jgi:hypothetical protein